MCSFRQRAQAVHAFSADGHAFLRQGAVRDDDRRRALRNGGGIIVVGRGDVVGRCSISARGRGNVGVGSVGGNGGARPLVALDRLSLEMALVGNSRGEQEAKVEGSGKEHKGGEATAGHDLACSVAMPVCVHVYVWMRIGNCECVRTYARMRGGGAQDLFYGFPPLAGTKQIRQIKNHEGISRTKTQRNENLGFAFTRPKICPQEKYACHVEAK